MSRTSHRLKRLLKRIAGRGSTTTTSPPAEQPREIKLNKAVIVRFSGGLANQMICYKLARYIADLNRSSIIIDATPYKSASNVTNRNFQLLNHHIRYDMLVFSEETMKDIKTSNRITTITKDMLPLPYPSVADEARVIASVAATDIIYCDFWLGMALRRAMDLHAEQHGILDELTLDHEKCFNERDYGCLSVIRNAENPVAIHIRRGDFATHDGNLLLTKEYYNRSIAELEQQLHDPVFVVFSDDIEWCRANLKSSAGLHFVDFTDETQAFKDMYLASECRHFILSNESTFSHQIVQLNRRGADRIVVTSSQNDLARHISGALQTSRT